MERKGYQKKGGYIYIEQTVVRGKKKHSKDNQHLKKTDKPRRSHFSILIVQFFLLTKINTSSSFRGVSKTLVIFQNSLNIHSNPPSYQTGLVWVKKVGYYQLQKPKEKADDWIIIVDESIGIGQEKVLVVLGIRRSNIEFNRPLKMQDLEPLLVKSKERWTGDMIAGQLRIVKAQIGNILYAVTDGCSTLKKGLREAEINHTYDITHSIAIVLERIYKNDDDFKEYTHKMGQMRIKLCNSKYAHLIPPNQRSKSRFLNIDIISNWGMKVLKALETSTISIEEREQLLWVKEKQSLIEEMNNIIDAVKKISILLKTSGLSKKIKRQCTSILKQCKEGKMKIFREHVIKYLNDNIVNIRKRGEHLVCSSDIIESTFGRYKNEISKNPMSGITDLALIIPALTIKLSNEEIKKAIDYSTVKQLKQWNKENLCESLSVKRNLVFPKTMNEFNFK